MVAAGMPRSRRPAADPEVATFAIVLLVALGVAATLLGRTIPHPTSQPHFQGLALAFLHRHLDIPPGTYDAATFGGRQYLPFGPLPALLLLPAVAIVGTGFPVAWLALAATAIAAPALWWVFAEAGVEARMARRWLVLLSLAGTCYLSAAMVDSSYFVTHLVVVACLAPALALALKGRAPAAAGALVGLAALTRVPAALAAVPLILLYVDRGLPRDRVRSGLAFIAGLLPLLVLLGLYNFARFGSPLEAGYSYQAQGDPTLALAKAAGTLAPAHLPKNLYNFLVAPPLPIGGDGAPLLHYPFLTPSEWGMGLIFVSPWLLAGLWARGRQAAILAAGAFLLLLPGLLQFGGGWVQFGYRYSLDALPFTAALVAVTVARRPGRWLPAAAVFCLAVNAWGADWLVHRLGA